MGFSKKFLESKGVFDLMEAPDPDPDPDPDLSDFVATGGFESKITGLLKRLWAKALRKVGVSTTGRIHDFSVCPDYFVLYRTGKRVAFISNRNGEFGLGDIVRLRELVIGQLPDPPREVHFFIKDIMIGFDGLKPGYFILTLE